MIDVALCIATEHDPWLVLVAVFICCAGAFSIVQMFERARTLLDGALIASLEQVAAALRLLAERNRIIAEGAGACPVACALAGQAGAGKIVCVVSGGNIDLDKLCAVLSMKSTI